MAAPLRKVTNRDLRHVGTSLSKRGSTITMTNKYRTVFTLDCGHRIEAPHSAPTVDAKRCKQCAVDARKVKP